MTSDDEKVVKAVWKSARAVEDWPGKVRILRFSPFNQFGVSEGEGATKDEAWKQVADRIRKIWEQEPNPHQQSFAFPPPSPDAHAEATESRNSSGIEARHAIFWMYSSPLRRVQALG